MQTITIAVEYEQPETSSSGEAPCSRKPTSTLSTSPAGATALCRSDHSRSKMSARAMTEAMIRSQIGQPAA